MRMESQKLSANLPTRMMVVTFSFAPSPWIQSVFQPFGVPSRSWLKLWRSCPETSDIVPPSAISNVLERVWWPTYRYWSVFHVPPFARRTEHPQPSLPMNSAPQFVKDAPSAISSESPCEPPT